MFILKRKHCCFQVFFILTDEFCKRLVYFEILTVQSSETIPPEVLKIQSQLAEVNKSVTNIKTAPGGLQEVTKTVADIKQEVTVVLHCHVLESLLVLGKTIFLVNTC